MDLHLDFAAASGGTLRARAESSLRDTIRSGRLPPGARLPPTRALAAELGVSRGVVVEAYAQLAAEGYLETRRGGGTLVAPGGPVAASLEAPAPQLPVVRHDLRPTLPAVDGFPRAAWLAALGRVLRSVPDARLGYPDPLGEPEWRAALAAWLGRRRGVLAEPSQVVATGGLRFGLPLVWGAFAAQGVRRVGVEQPGWPRIAETLLSTGLEPVPLPVDAHGIDPAALAGLDAVAVTPAHQFPTGAVLGAERRRALVAWARKTGGWIFEDDYDAEFRYDRQPVGSLQGLAPDVVVHGGSASKVLAPALRQGWLVLPPALTVTDPGHLVGTPSPVDQLALADLVGRGEVDRHLRRRRIEYGRRRGALIAALARELPGSTVEGAAAGLFLVLPLPRGADERAIVERSAAAGLLLEGLGAPGRAGLVLGYANLPEAAAGAAASALASLL